MSNAEFIRICKEKVCAYTNEYMDKTDKKKITVDDVYVVWCCKTLQNHKALLSTTARMECIMSLHIMGTKMNFIWMLIKNGKIFVTKCKERENYEESNA